VGLITDGLLISGTLFAGIYCWMLSRRVQALKSLDSGLGGAIVTLTRQIELARTTLDEARDASGDSRRELGELTARSEAAAGQLRLLLVATKDPLARAQLSDRVDRPSRYDAILQPADEPTVAPPGRPAAPPAQHEPISVRRRDGLGPRLVSLPQFGAALADQPDVDLAPEGVPKPRRTQSLEAMIRRRMQAEPTPPRTEEDLLVALGTIASGRER